MAFPKRAAKALSRVPQPSARIPNHPYDGPKQLGEVYEWARENTQPTPSGFYPIEGYSVDGDEGPAQIARTTPSDFFRSQYGETNWNKIRNSILGRGVHPDIGIWDPMKPWERMERLDAPVYTVMGQHVGNQNAPKLDLIELNPWQMMKLEPGYPMQAVATHEMAHQGTPVLSSRPVARKAISEDEYLSPDPDKAYDSIRRDWARSGDTAGPGQVVQMANQLRHNNDVSEAAANLSHSRMLYHGLTGELPIEPDEWAAMLSHMQAEPVSLVNRTPNVDIFEQLPGAFTPFEDDPIMQYGPNAGKPAEGWNQMRYYWQKLLRDALMREKQALLELGPYIADTPEPTDAAAV